jgi:hypothetical protein
VIVTLSASDLVTGAPVIGAPPMRVKRSSADWAFIQAALAFVIAMENAIMAPWSRVVFCALAVLTAWAFYDWGCVHNVLVGLRIRLHEKFR